MPEACITNHISVQLILLSTLHTLMISPQRVPEWTSLWQKLHIKQWMTIVQTTWKLLRPLREGLKELTQCRSGRTELLKEQEQVFSLHIHFLKIELGFCEKLSCRITASLWFHQLRHKRLFVVCCKFWLQVKIPYLLVIFMIISIMFCK